ncbi:uncharacterized protein LOC135098647 isoform X1 [Scylla paramamosain]|uniref:uncharacterized protein LOC135098647 isoform X1 n=1 Tax=Scylla paramamosain TaxID=85552 RepID=UPI0030833FCE
MSAVSGVWQCISERQVRGLLHGALLPPGAPQPNAGIAPIPRGPRPHYPPERMHGDGYLSSPERSPRPYGGGGLPSSPPPLVTRILTMGASTHHAAAPSPPSLTRRPGQRSTV